LTELNQVEGDEEYIQFQTIMFNYMLLNTNSYYDIQIHVYSADRYGVSALELMNPKLKALTPFEGVNAPLEEGEMKGTSNATWGLAP